MNLALGVFRFFGRVVFYTRLFASNPESGCFLFYFILYFILSWAHFSESVDLR